MVRRREDGGDVARQPGGAGGEDGGQCCAALEVRMGRAGWRGIEQGESADIDTRHRNDTEQSKSPDFEFSQGLSTFIFDCS